VNFRFEEPAPKPKQLPWRFAPPDWTAFVPSFYEGGSTGWANASVDTAGMVRNYTVIMLNNGVGPMMQTCAHADDYQIEECRRLKALPGGKDKPCIVYWNGQNALGWYAPPPNESSLPRASWLASSLTANLCGDPTSQGRLAHELDAHIRALSSFLT
jgi:hypothetical protein